MPLQAPHICQAISQRRIGGTALVTPEDAHLELSPWRRVMVLSVILVGFSILIYLAFKA
jgi:hypothetical protein